MQTAILQRQGQPAEALPYQGASAVPVDTLAAPEVQRENLGLGVARSQSYRLARRRISEPQRAVPDSRLLAAKRRRK